MSSGQGYADYGYRSVEQAWTYAYLMPPLCRLLGRPDGPVLDLGCGNGAIARALLEAGHDVYGVDASPSGIAIANGLYPGRFFELNVDEGRLPAALADVPFTTVISTEVIEHLYNPRSLLTLAHSILSAHGGGQLLISTPYHGYLKNLALALTGKLDGHFTALWDGGHIKFFSRATLQQMLTEQGFEVLDFAGAGRLPWLWKSMVVRAWVGGGKRE